MEQDEIIVLTDEDGNEEEFVYLGGVDYEGKNYAVMMPNDEEDNDVVILEVIAESTEEVSYESPESDELMEAVFAAFKEKFKDEFDFG